MRIRINDCSVEVEEGDLIEVKHGESPIEVKVIRHAVVIKCLEIG